MPDPRRIADASPVIVLARIGRFDLLGGAVIVPAAVAAEILAGPPDDAARVLVERGRLGPHPPVDVPVGVVEWGLGAGESSVLALALADPGSVRSGAAALGSARPRYETQPYTPNTSPRS